MKIVCTEAEYVALLDRFKIDVTVIEKGDERVYRGVNTLYGIPVEVEDGNTVRVVRCKDCEHFVDAKGKDSGKPCGYGQCASVSGLRRIICADDFYSGGERRTNDGEI